MTTQNWVRNIIAVCLSLSYNMHCVITALGKVFLKTEWFPSYRSTIFKDVLGAWGLVEVTEVIISLSTLLALQNIFFLICG